MHLERSSNGQLINLSAATTLGVGGEARIFAPVEAPELAAKIYHRPLQEHAAKLAAMLSNPPDDPMRSQGGVSIAWPTDLLVHADSTRRVAGFLMPRVSGMHPIIDFYHPATRRKKHRLFNYLYLLRTARNLASCVAALHARGYVIGDVNESNILVGETALVTIVDTDSFQVPDPGGRIFRCRVGKPEFTPPELQATKFAWIDRRPEHDLFGLGVLLFQLLMEGTHPFSGRFRGWGEPPGLEERIARGAFPYGGAPDRPALPMPSAPPFEILGQRVGELFLRCFVSGHTDPTQRPTAEAWQRALLDAEITLMGCSTNDQHLYGRHLPACPWCERKRLLRGRDPFPSRTRVQAKGGHRRRAGTPQQSPLTHEAAVALALQTIARRKLEKHLFRALAVLTGAGLVAFWWWALSLSFAH